MIQTGERYLIFSSALKYATTSGWSEHFRLAKIYIRKGDAQNRVDRVNHRVYQGAEVYPVKIKFDIEDKL
jgi:hypothetical protein